VNTVTDAESKTTTTAYDTWGNINKVTLHDATFQSFTNNARGDVLTSTDAEGRMITNTWNKRRQLLTTTDPAIPGEPAATITNTYDNPGNLAASEDENGNISSYTWNALGKPVTSTLPALASGANTVTTTYDSRDWIEKTTNSLNQVMRREYDAAHRMTAIVDPLNRRTENTYDPKAQMLTTTDPLSRVEEMDWTDRGELNAETDGEDKDTLFAYDKNGNRTTLTDRRGKVYTFAYDDANRLTSTTTPGGKITAMTYFDNNLVKTIKEPSGQTTTHAYNGKNLVSSKSDPTGTMSYVYDDSGLLETVTEGADTITRTYDERGRVKTYTNEDGDFLQYRYDGHGNLTRLTYPDGRHVHYTYNERNLLETVTDWSNRVTSYHYDRLGRLIGITRPNGTSSVIDRDAADQVLSIRESTNGKLFSLLKFDYDLAGQIQSRFLAPIAQSGFQQPSFSATYDDDNRLLTVNGSGVTHDADGNMTLGPISVSSGNTALVYNSRNQLTSAGGISYTYDAEGHRRTLTDSAGTTRFTIDANANMSRLLVRTASNGSKTYYVYGIGLLYEADEAGKTKTYHFDQVGSTIARTDDSGKVIGRAEYSAYGLVAMQTGDMATPFQYNGQWGIQTDGNGLLNMRARYYSPFLMRFLNPDPIGFSGGQNWFAYADGDPISRLDPFGLWGWGNSISLALDFIPTVGTIKGAVELAAGYDFIAGEDVNRGVSAAGLVAGLIPGGKAAVKGGAKMFSAGLRNADEAAEVGKAVVKNGDGVVYKRVSTQGEEYFGQAMDNANFARRRYSHDSTSGLNGPHNFEVAGRAQPGLDLDILEETFIRNGGGTVREGSSLLNKNHVMNSERYLSGVNQRLRGYQQGMLLQNGLLNGSVQSINRIK
jgi:RHS repeat-associated protein